MSGHVPLSEIGLNRPARVVEIRGGSGIVQRLAELGIFSGTVLTVLRGKGPVIVESRGQRLVIGHGMVGRILVEPLHGPEAP